MPLFVLVCAFAFVVGFAAGAVGIFLILAKPDED